MKNLHKEKYFLIGLLVLFPLVVLAQLPTVNPQPAPGLTLQEIENLIKRVAQFIIVLGVVLALIFIVVGGISWMKAGGDEEAAKKAKKRIWSGIWGALIVIGVGVILQTLAKVVTRTFFT